MMMATIMMMVMPANKAPFALLFTAEYYVYVVCALQEDQKKGTGFGGASTKVQWESW